MARQGNPGDNPTASSVLDPLNSGEELSSDESDECDYTSDLEITEERSEQGLDYFEKRFNSTQGVLSAFKAARYFSP